MDQTQLISAIEQWKEEGLRWQKQGQSLREQLLATRDAAAKQLHELDKHMEGILAEKGVVKHQDLSQQKRDSKPDTITTRDSDINVVRKLLRMETQPVGASEVISLVLAIRPKTPKTHVRSALWRLKKLGEVETTGDPGSWKYLWKGIKETAMDA